MKDGKLILLNQGNIILNSDLLASYGYVDTASPARCTAEVINVILEIHIICASDEGNVDLATFKIGREDAEKIVVKGVTGKTEKLDGNAGKANVGINMSTSRSQQAPEQPVIQPGAKQLSFSGGGETITFYSNGQYHAEGVVYIGGQVVSCTITDTYTISSDTLSLHANNQVACTVVFSRQVMSCGAPNVSMLSKEELMKLGISVETSIGKYKTNRTRCGKHSRATGYREVEEIPVEAVVTKLEEEIETVA